MHDPDRLDDADDADDAVPTLAPAHNGVPPEVGRMGLSRHTDEGALIEFASSLDSAKPSHKFIAWLMLLAFVAPALLALLAALF
jgi:hypothetical protein